MTFKEIQKTIKKNPATEFYPDPDEFESYEDYEEAYHEDRDTYIQHIAEILGYALVDDMFEDIEGVIDEEDAKEDLFGFFYDRMVMPDYFESDYDNYDDYNDEYDDYNGNDYDY